MAAIFRSRLCVNLDLHWQCTQGREEDQADQRSAQRDRGTEKGIHRHKTTEHVRWYALPGRQKSRRA